VDSLAEAYGLGLGEALRYLAGPPISDDDLQVLADVDSIAPGILKKSPEAVRKVFEVIERVIDPTASPGWKPARHQLTSSARWPYSHHRYSWRRNALQPSVATKAKRIRNRR